MDRQERPKPASTYLTGLGRAIAGSYVEHTAPSAVLLTGSAASGLADHHSDLDLILYYDRLPGETKRSSALAAIGSLGTRTSDDDGGGRMVVEEHDVAGVACQVAHRTIESWEQDLSTVLDDHTPGTLIEKAIIGLLNGRPLHGGGQIATWQSRAATYPEGLVHATVWHHLRFFPLWMAAERWESRDANLFLNQMLAESSLNLLAVLAGLNRRYFSAFQFNHLHDFVDTLELTPDRLAERIDSLFEVDSVRAGSDLERLVDETLSLVEARLPDIDTAPTRWQVGIRHRPWTPRTLEGDPLR